MAAATRELQRAILAYIKQAGSAGPKEISDALGGGWRTPSQQTLLRQLLRRMVKKRLLITPTYGVYEVPPDSPLRTIDTRAWTEEDIRQFLKERGGIAKTAEIHAGVGGRRRGDLERTYDHHRVTLALKASFRQDFGRGYWNLAEDELERLPQLGRWASRQIHEDWVFKGPSEGFDTWQEMRQDRFHTIGAAFAEARDERTIAEVTTHPDIVTALQVMGLKAPAARALALDQFEAQVRTEVQADGVTEPYKIAEAIRERKPLELPWYIFDAFECGNLEMHLAAPVELYVACAALFGVCPAKLSRGEVVRVPAA